MQIIAIAIRGTLWPIMFLNFVLFPYSAMISQTVFDFLKVYSDENFSKIFPYMGVNSAYFFATSKIPGNLIGSVK